MAEIRLTVEVVGSLSTIIFEGFCTIPVVGYGISEPSTVGDLPPLGPQPLQPR